MCGRYTVTASAKELAERFKASVDAAISFKPSYNVAPTQLVPVVINQDGRRLEMLRWGLIPSWSKDGKMVYATFNARAESITEKPTYRGPFKRTRCLFPATAIYEWPKSSNVKPKIPTCIVMKSREPFAMAGVWDTWKNPAGGEIRSASIVTTEANAVLKKIPHDRMPVLLGEREQSIWLDPASESDKLLSLLQPFPAKAMEGYKVSPVVNNARHNAPDCIEPLAS